MTVGWIRSPYLGRRKRDFRHGYDTCKALGLSSVYKAFLVQHATYDLNNTMVILFDLIYCDGQIPFRLPFSRQIKQTQWLSPSNSP